MEAIDYLVIGHLSRDVVSTGFVVGGTVAYAGRAAQAIGANVAILTSTVSDEPGIAALPSIQVCSIEAKVSTTFENVYTENGRLQILHDVAEPITSAHVPSTWTQPSIVHFGPLANEIDPPIVHQFSNSIIGMTPQGWMRRWDENGHVYAQEWEQAAEILPLATAVIISTEDLLNDEMLGQYKKWSKLLVLTQGPKGCTVFCDDETHHIPVPEVTEVEPTGAGDIFAAAFLLKYQQTDGDYCQAAAFANEIAAQSVTQPGLDAKMACIEQFLSEN